MKLYEKDISRLQRAYLSFISIPSLFLAQFNVQVSLPLPSKLVLTSKLPTYSLPSAISLLTHLLSHQISQQQQTLNKLTSQFQYFRGLCHPTLLHLKQQYRILIIPYFYCKQSELYAMKKENTMLVVGPDTRSIAAFMEQYRKVDWCAEILLSPSKTYEIDFTAVNDVEKYAALKLAGVLGDLGVIGSGETLQIPTQHLQRYCEIESQYVLDTAQVPETVWLRVSSEPDFQHIFHEIQISQELNRIIYFPAPRRETLFYLRRKKSPPFSESLKKHNILFNLLQKQRCIVLGNRDLNDNVKRLFHSKLKSFFIHHSVKYEALPDPNLLVIFYKSPRNLNMECHRLLRDIVKQHRTKHRYRISGDIRLCLERYYYKSKLDILASECRFTWEIQRGYGGGGGENDDDDGFALVVSSFNGDIVEVEGKLGELISSMTLYRYVFSGVSEEKLAEIEGGRVNLKMRKLRENVLRRERVGGGGGGGRVVVEGIVVGKEDLREIDDDVKELVERYEMRFNNVKRNAVSWKEFRLERVEEGEGIGGEDISRIDVRVETMSEVMSGLDFDVGEGEGEEGGGFEEEGGGMTGEGDA